MTHAIRELQSLPPGVVSRLTQFRRRVRWVKTCEALLAGCFGLISTYLVLLIAERFCDLHWGVRASLLVVGMLGFACYVPWMLHRWVWRTRHLENVARLLRYRFPKLSDHVLSVVELASSQQEQSRSPKLIAAAMAQVDKRLETHDLLSGVPAPRHRRWALAVSLPLVAVAIAFVCFPAVAWNAMVRFLSPASSTPRYTFSKLQQLPESMVIPYAEPFSLAVVLDERTDWHPPTGHARLMGQTYRSPASDRSQFIFELPGQMEPSNVQVQVGDAWTKTQIVPTMRPEVLNVAAEVTLPEYLQHSQTTTLDARGGSLSILHGSRFRCMARANRELRSATANDAPVEVTGSLIHSGERQVDSNDQLKLEWIDRFGLSSAKPLTLRIRSVEDQAPSVRCNNLADQMVLLSTELFKFDVMADDDFGLRWVGLEWQGVYDSLDNPNPSMGEKKIIEGGPEVRRLTGIATLSSKLDSIEPQTLQLRVFAEDYLPGRPRSYSPTYTVKVLSPEDHAKWIGEQLRRWKGKADAVYDEELRLLEENRELRRAIANNSSQASLAQRMEQQAANERANQQRLEAVTRDGQKLLEQAIRNEEIRAKQIEQWVEALERLNQISKNDMPSLSKKLDAAAGEAKAGASALTIPTTQLGPSDTDSKSKSSEKKANEASNTHEHKMDDVVKDHAKLIEEFRRAREAFENLMTDFENSSFVRRLKAAARYQSEMASRLNALIATSFGLASSELSSQQKSDVESIAKSQVAQAENLINIQNDLQAYQNSAPSPGREEIIREMKDLNTIIKLQEMPERLARNLRGDALSRTEFWADTFDRWAEELAGPGNNGGGGKNKESMPPALLLEVMRILGEEMDLRDETRVAQQTKNNSLDNVQESEERSAGLAVHQLSIQERTLNVIQDIQALPKGAKLFGEELSKLNKSVEAMDDASSALSEFNTGEEAIAAETAAIEALLQTNRGGKGGGGDNGDGSMAGGNTNRTPLEMLGLASGLQNKPTARQVGDGTGKTGRSLPEEYRDGLDSFFNEMSRLQQGP